LLGWARLVLAREPSTPSVPALCYAEKKICFEGGGVGVALA
jgi:hypothetical protein